MNRTGLRQKGALSESQAIKLRGKARIDYIYKLSRMEDLEATKETILREAEYVLAVLSEDKAFWDDVTKGNIVCSRCCELLDPQSVYLSLVSVDGYMLPDEAKRFLRGEGCPSCRPDFFERASS